MRDTKLGLIVGLVSFAMYGCGDSGSGTKKYDGSVDTGPGVMTDTASVTLDSATDSPGATKLDAALKLDTAPIPPDGGGKADAPAASVDVGPVSPALDGGVRGIDGPADVDVGAKLDSAAVIDVRSQSDVAATDGSSGGGACVFPQCYVDLVKDCVPQGDCVRQTTTSGLSSTNASCYANGVKQQTATTVTLDITTMSMSGVITMSTKNASGLCYTLDAPYSTDSADVTFTMKNAAGGTVATLRSNSTNNTTTITCTGQAPVVVSNDCDAPAGVDAGSANTATCTTGTCSF